MRPAFKENKNSCESDWHLFMYFKKLYFKKRTGKIYVLNTTPVLGLNYARTMHRYPREKRNNVIFVCLPNTVAYTIDWRALYITERNLSYHG